MLEDLIEIIRQRDDGEITSEEANRLKYNLVKEVDYVEINIDPSACDT